MEAHTRMTVVLRNGDEHVVHCAIGVGPQHMPGHLLMVTALDGTRRVWNFKHVESYTLEEVPATPAEGS